MRILLIVLFFNFFTGYCKSTTISNFQDSKEKRFLIPVFLYSEYDRTKNLQLTETFAKHWKDESGFDYFIKDKKITEDILRSGSLLPSTNYSIDCEFHKPGTKIVLVCSLKDLESGELISSDSIKGNGILELEKELKVLARKLYKGH